MLTIITPTTTQPRCRPPLVRISAAQHSSLKGNRKRIQDYPNLWGYVRDLVAWPGVAKTVHPRQYIANYYSIDRLNPTGIIPKGCPVDFSTPHDRAKFE